MIIRKFGGSSVKDATRIRQVADIVLKHKEESTIVVLSAQKGVTNTLISLAEKAERGDSSYRNDLKNLETKITSTANELVEDKDLMEFITLLLSELKDILHGIELVKECSQRSKDLVMSFGERFNARIFTSYLIKAGAQATYFDARDLILTDETYGAAIVDYPETNRNILETMTQIKGISVVTGFIAASRRKTTTTLGRNGSDYTASILGAALNAEKVEIWTDVDGVLSADPRVVHNAYVLEEVSIQEAMELSYFGAEVIHPSTMLPVIEKSIPIVIKNTLNPSAPGTIIKESPKPNNMAITGIASIDEVSLINIEGGGMIGHPGVASRVFSALAEKNINIIMISQASSEHSICLVCKTSEAQRALDALEEKLSRDKEEKRIQSFDLVNDLEIIAIIGENMRGTPGISGRLFNALGQASINVLAIAQGSSERNISFVVEKKDRKTALNVVHSAFLAPSGVV